MAAMTIVDVVGVLDSSFRQVFPDARPMKASVKEESKVMQHPVENGSNVVDHRVLLPVEIKLTVILAGDSYRDTYQQIKQYYLRAELFSVQTISDTYPNMLISAMPHEETPDISDAIPMELSFTEMRIATTKFGTARHKKNARDKPTTGRGQQQGQAASSSQKEKGSSMLADIFS